MILNQCWGLGAGNEEYMYVSIIKKRVKETYFSSITLEAFFYHSHLSSFITSFFHNSSLSFFISDTPFFSFLFSLNYSNSHSLFTLFLYLTFLFHISFSLHPFSVFSFSSLSPFLILSYLILLCRLLRKKHS